MHPLHTDLPVIFLKPGELFLGEQPAVVVTILGSCVSMIFYDRTHRLGAICHALLPTDTLQENSFRFVDRSFYWMLKQFQSRGIVPSQIQGKLFGGADVLEFFQGKCRTATVGQQNIHKALELYKAHGLQVQASSLGGTWGRKIFFYTHTGEVLLRRLEKLCWLAPKQWDSYLPPPP
ncbi:MAG: chemotaxis protein CheD [Thermodesulfobacteriota bacterium]